MVVLILVVVVLLRHGARLVLEALQVEVPHVVVAACRPHALSLCASAVDGRGNHTKEM